MSTRPFSQGVVVPQRYHQSRCANWTCIQIDLYKPTEVWIQVFFFGFDMYRLSQTCSFQILSTFCLDFYCLINIRAVFYCFVLFVSESHCLSLISTVCPLFVLFVSYSYCLSLIRFICLRFILPEILFLLFVSESYCLSQIRNVCL